MELNSITEKIIGCCIEVHKELGPGLLESIYESALCIEFEYRNLKYERQKSLPVLYKTKPIGDFRIDLLIENKLVLEIKSVERHEPVFEAQLLSYLKLGGFKIGLLINFSNSLVKDGIKRIIL